MSMEVTARRRNISNLFGRRVIIIALKARAASAQGDRRSLCHSPSSASR